MTKNNSKILDLSKEANAEAQRKLDALCATVNMSSWNIGAGSGKARWRDLVLSLCDIEIQQPKKAGRPKVGVEHDNQIFQRVLIDQIFQPQKKRLKTSLQNVADNEKSKNGKVRAARNRAIKRRPEALEDLAKNYDPHFPLDDE